MFAFLLAPSLVTIAFAVGVLLPQYEPTKAMEAANSAVCRYYKKLLQGHPHQCDRGCDCGMVSLQDLLYYKAATVIAFKFFSLCRHYHDHDHHHHYHYSRLFSVCWYY